MAISFGPTSRGAITRVRWNDRTVLTARSIMASTASPSKVKSGLNLSVMPSSILSASAGSPTGRRRRAAGRRRRCGLGLLMVSVWPLTISTRWSASLRKPCWICICESTSAASASRRRPDLLALRPAADVGQPREDRVAPAGVDGRDELDVHRQHIVGGVGESLDDLVDLLEDLGRIVGAQLGPAGREHGDLFAVPFADAGPLEDPLDDGFLRVELAAQAVGELGVTCDRVSPPLESPASGEKGAAGSSSGAGSSGSSSPRDRPEGLVSRLRRLAAPTVCATADRGNEKRPPNNIDSIRAMRRFMPGGLLAGLADDHPERVEGGFLTEERFCLKSKSSVVEN